MTLLNANALAAMFFAVGIIMAAVGFSGRPAAPVYCPPENASGVLLEKEKVHHGKGNYSHDVLVAFEAEGVKQICRTSVSTEMFDYVEVGDKVKTLNRH